MDSDRTQGHHEVCPVNALNPPHIRQMLHVPSYHNIQPVENRQGHMQRVVPKAGGDRSILDITLCQPFGLGSDREVFRADKAGLWRYLTEQ